MPKNLPPKAWTRADIAQELHEYVYDEHKIVVDVAVGIAVGFAAQSLSMIADLVTPLIAAAVKAPSFNGLSFTFNGSVFLYGDFINAVITFLTICFCVFTLMVYPIVKAKKREAADRAKRLGPSERECSYCLSLVPVAARCCRYCTRELEVIPHFVPDDLKNEPLLDVDAHVPAEPKPWEKLGFTAPHVPSLPLPKLFSKKGGGASEEEEAAHAAAAAAKAEAAAAVEEGVSPAALEEGLASPASSAAAKGSGWKGKLFSKKGGDAADKAAHAAAAKAEDGGAAAAAAAAEEGAAASPTAAAARKSWTSKMFATKNNGVSSSSAAGDAVRSAAVKAETTAEEGLRNGSAAQEVQSLLGSDAALPSSLTGLAAPP